MKETIADKILKELQKDQVALSYGDLAWRLELNEPSVRRTIRQDLIPRGLVREIEWSLFDNRLFVATKWEKL